MKCAQDGGCQRRATHAPLICIPPAGWPREVTRCVQMQLSLQLCHAHARAFDPFAVLDLPSPGDPDKSVGEAVAAAVAIGEGVPLDVARAWCVAIRTDSPEFVAFLARTPAAAKAGPGGHA